MSSEGKFIMETIVSVIVPVYKVERYIRRCLESIISQSYQGLEVILIDDGSPDKCGEICDEYALKDKRIIVIHQENRGNSAARNAGLDRATGEYIVFVDSDDAVPNDMVEKLLDACKKNDAQIAIGNFEVFTDQLPKADAIENEVEVFDNGAVIPFIHTVPGEKFVVVWGKIYSSKLFETLRFPGRKTNEDLSVLYRLYDMAERVVLINRTVYWYFRGNTDSLTYKLSDEFYADVYTVLNEERYYLAVKHPEMVKFPMKTQMYWLYDEYKKLFSLKKDRARRKQIYQRYCAIYEECKGLPKEKFYKFFRYAPNIYCFLKKQC